MYMKETDTIISNNAYIYRYDTKKNKFVIYPNSLIVHRVFGMVDEWIGFYPGNPEGIYVKHDQNNVFSKSSIYFYMWSDEKLDDKELWFRFDQAISGYFNKQIKDSEKKTEKLKNNWQMIEKNLKETFNV